MGLTVSFPGSSSVCYYRHNTVACEARCHGLPLGSTTWLFPQAHTPVQNQDQKARLGQASNKAQPVAGSGGSFGLTSRMPTSALSVGLSEKAASASRHLRSTLSQERSLGGQAATFLSHPVLLNKLMETFLSGMQNWEVH